MRKAIDWLYVSDWRMFAVMVATQILFVLAFIWFSHWISDYARLNWY